MARVLESHRDGARFHRTDHIKELRQTSPPHRPQAGSPIGEESTPLLDT
jgi:hypothetical protein